jgi:diaminopimelate epimerase
MTTMRLTKHHGLGNDFLVALVDAVPADGAALARAWCHRTHGIGADGLIFGTPPAAGSDADLTFTLFNADGSAAGISGNGIRCLAQAVVRRDAVTEASLAIATADRIRRVDVWPGEQADEITARVDMGVVGPGPAVPDLTALAEVNARRVATGDVGNPHVVIEVDDLAEIDAAVHGPAIEAGWPGGINVHFLAPVGDDAIELLHWERGVGVTEACGSGATVGAAVAHKWGIASDRVTVQMPGGSAAVELGDTAWLVGPAVYIATIEVDLA